jgi:phosphate:Na+ symporter
VSSIIGLSGAIAIMMGDNIGTTFISLLASVGQTVNAKRTAVCHSFLNISGSVLFLMLLPKFTDLIVRISPKGPEVQVISRQIANSHTVFNLAGTILWLPFVGVMVKIVKILVPGENE